MKVYRKLASHIDARERCRPAMVSFHDGKLEEIMQGAPSGSGFDAGTEIDDTSTGEKLVFNTMYHHMDESGYYSGWTTHKITVTPSLMFGFELDITTDDPTDADGTMEYIADTFNYWLDEEVTQ